jgi:hypothetical protein
MMEQAYETGAVGLEYESDSDEPPALTNEWNDDDEYGYGGTYRFGHSVLNEVERAISVPNVGLQGVALSREQRVGGCGVTIWGG